MTETINLDTKSFAQLQKHITFIQIEVLEDYLLLVTLNRPEVRNAFNTQMASDLHLLLQWIEDNPFAFRCIMLRGAGEKAFCAGADLKEREGMNRTQWDHQHKIFEAMAYAVYHCKVPIIALINGSAFGGGMELLLSCDMAIAADHAKFALPEVGLGIMPGLGATQILAKLIGANRAKEIILSGNGFDADKALSYGILNQIVAYDQLMETGITLARKIASNAPLAVQAALKAIDQASELGFAEGLIQELIGYNLLIDTKDRLEGIQAFNQKRKPVFKAH